MPDIDFKEKYKKYKHKYLDAKRFVGGANYEDNSNVPIIELYEYNLEGYDRDKRYKFQNITTRTSDCGVIKIKDQNIPADLKDKLSSCDIINSPGTYIGKILSGGYMGADVIKKIIDVMKKIYINNSTRIQQELPKNICEHIDIFKNICSVIKDIYGKNFDPLKYNNNDKYGDEHSYVQKIDVTSEEKIVMMGDIHGSFHTFMRLLYRYHLYGILDIETMIIANGYKIVFLGDVIDRGNYSIEIIFIIFILISVNNLHFDDPQKWKIYYIRGNHEELSTSSDYGFKKELENKKCTGDNNKLYLDIMSTIAHFPSAILLNVTDIEKNNSGGTNDNFKIWLSHGGFPWYNNKMEWTDNISILDKLHSTQTRWSDFKDHAFDGPRINALRRNDSLIYSGNNVNNFMEREGINFIVRGHQDNCINSFLFTDKPDKCGEYYDYDISLRERNDNDVLYYNKGCADDKTNYVKGPIARILCDNREFQNANKPKLYPVLTISTNTDLDRFLSSDSFALLRFDLFKKDITQFKNILTIKNELINDPDVSQQKKDTSSCTLL